MLKLLKRTLFVSSVSSVLFVASAYHFNKSFEPYSQEIPGTGISFDMVPIPEGSFKMGSDNGASDEAPIHEVNVDPFWMASHEVTWDLYELFLDKSF
ncbi:hypothetical protein ADICYQ_4900 [Cyclobacterium qasimii M12-11B]|nr:hypothetical protein ADICYQ_4900 [Cyclobacterium qasimii M12-11B]